MLLSFRSVMRTNLLRVLTLHKQIVTIVQTEVVVIVVTVLIKSSVRQVVSRLDVLNVFGVVFVII